MTGKMTRAERLAKIAPLRRRGLTAKEIAEHLGWNLSVVRNIITDPDGSKGRRRKDSYRGQCVECGFPTDGSNGPERAPTRCIYCSTGRVRPASARPRLCVPVRLDEIPEPVRLKAVAEANRSERDEDARLEVLLAALSPSDRVYWVSDRARPLIESWAA